ncbi:minor capsid protein, partial [Amycolatopsis sp. NPDC000673]|uniref:minor capsid protein n=1 Tax=Amycolatopsis sp. NPDC000673 TaxID=3154267 RepID=UPI00332A9B0F
QRQRLLRLRVELLHELRPQQPSGAQLGVCLGEIIEKTTAPEQPNRAVIADALIWLSARAASGGQDVAGTVRRELEHILDGVWTDGYYVGDRAAVWTAREAIVAAAKLTGEQLPAEAAGHATVTASIDWGAWSPGDTEAARRVLGGGLDRLLAQAHVTIRSVVPGRMDALAETLAEGLEAGLAPAEIARNLDGVLTDRAWASMVAETETARAISAATQDRYLGIGVTANTWMTATDQRVCPACRDNESAGPVSIGQSFPSGASGPPGHPRCRCALAPVVDSIANIAWPTLEPTGAVT